MTATTDHPQHQRADGTSPSHSSGSQRARIRALDPCQLMPELGKQVIHPATDARPTSCPIP